MSTTHAVPQNFIENIVNNTDEIIYCLNDEGFLMYASHRWTDILGHNIDEVLGKNISEFIDPKHYKKCQKYFLKIMSGNTRRKSISYKAKHKTAGLITLENHASKTYCLVNNAPLFLGSCRDITAKKKFKKKAKKQKQKFKLLVENSNDFVYSTTTDGILTYISPKCLDLGYSNEELLGQKYTFFVHPDFHEILYNYILAIVSGQPPAKPQDIIIINKNGEENWFAIKGNFLKSKKSQSSTFIGTAVNITEKVNEQKIIETQINNFKAIFEETLGGYWEWDLIDQDLHLSAGLKKNLGINENDFVRPQTNPLISFMDSGEFEKYWTEVKKYIAKNDPNAPFRYQINFRHGKGHLVTNLVSGIVAERKGTRIKKMIGCLIDITERVENSKKLELQLDNFKSIFEHSLNGHWQWDLETHQLMLSDKLKAHMGYESINYQDCLINPLIDVLEPQDFELFWKAIIQYLKTQPNTSFLHQLKIKHKLGHVVTLLVSAIIVESENRLIKKIMGCVVDISEISDIKNKLEQQNIELKTLKDLDQKATKDIAYQIMLGQERERNVIAQELHDGINQMLFAAKIQIQEAYSKNDLLFTNGINLIDKAIEEIKYIATSQNSFLMFNKTLYEGINELLLSLPRNKIKFNLKETNKDNLRISNNKRIIVLRIIQELIHNMMKYANATESNIYIKKTINRFSLMVSDNGIGFDVKNIQKGNGLINLENKLKIIDGDHIIKSRIDKGTIFYITFPI